MMTETAPILNEELETGTEWQSDVIDGPTPAVNNANAMDPFILALEMVKAPIFLFSAQGDIIFANMAGSDYVSAFQAHEHMGFCVAVREAIAHLGPDQTGMASFRRDELGIQPLEMGNETFFSVQISEKVESECPESCEDLEYLAYHDDLTGLKNFRGYRKAMENLAAPTSEGEVSLILVDVDNFKKVNDTWGHLFGNWVLEETGRFLRERIRTGDEGFRIGGDEFAIVSHQSDDDKAREWAARIHRDLTRHIRETTGNHSLSISMGHSRLNVTGTSPDNVFKMADEALYKAKESGKSTIVLS
jgi:diguanylate cyclase (GGDEF)-like protein